jgi:methyl-accepting chemotaxis protein
MPQSETKLHIGEAAPDFNLTDVQGKAHQLSAALQRGPVLLFFFRGTWCPDCRTYLKELEDHFHNFTAAGVEVLGIAHQRADIVAGYFKREPISYPYLLDTDARVITSYGLLRDFAIDSLLLARERQTTHPACFLIDQAGVIRWMYVGDGRRDLPDLNHIDEEIAKLGHTAASGSASEAAEGGEL